MLKVNNRDTRTKCYIHSKLTIKTQEKRNFTPCSSVSIVNFEHVIASWDEWKIQVFKNGPSTVCLSQILLGPWSMTHM